MRRFLRVRVLSDLVLDVPMVDGRFTLRTDNGVVLLDVDLAAARVLSLTPGYALVEQEDD